MLLQRQLERLNICQIYNIGSIGSLLSVIFRDSSDKICLSVSSLYIYQVMAVAVGQGEEMLQI